MSAVDGGWARPSGCTVRHWFRTSGSALCNRLVYLGPVQAGDDDAPGTCAQCRRRLGWLRAGADPRPAEGEKGPRAARFEIS